MNRIMMSAVFLFIGLLTAMALFSNQLHRWEVCMRPNVVAAIASDNHVDLFVELGFYRNEAGLLGSGRPQSFDFKQYHVRILPEKHSVTGVIVSSGHKTRTHC